MWLWLRLLAACGAGSGTTGDKVDPQETTGVPDASVEVTEILFGDVPVSEWGLASESVAVHNVGAAPLTLRTPHLDSVEFTAEVVGLAEVAAGATGEVRVGFDPSGAGDAAATLTISTNDPDQPTYEVSLSARATEGVLEASVGTIARINVTVRLGRRAFGSMGCQGRGLSRPAWLQICPQRCEMRDSSGPRVPADAPGRDHLA